MYAPFRLQSAQILFSGRFTSSLSVRVFFSAVALSSLDIVGTRFSRSNTQYYYVHVI